MYLERLFASVGTRIDSNLIGIILLGVAPQVDDKDENAIRDFSPEELKNYQKKLESRRKRNLGFLKKAFVNFIKLINAQDFRGATLELIELTYQIPELNLDLNFNALLTLCWVAIRKYEAAEATEKAARKNNSRWEVFDTIVDDAYDSAKFFMAEEMKTTVQKLDIDQELVNKLNWDESDSKRLTIHLGQVLELENATVWESIKSENIKFQLKEDAILDDLIVQLCDQIILPFYARLELNIIVGNSKMDD